MKLRLIYILIIACCITKSVAQDSLSFNKKYIAKNNLSIDLGGTAQVGSLNYERSFCIKDNSFQTLSAGFLYYPPSDGGQPFYLPISYSYGIGKKKSKLILGLGLTLLVSTEIPSPADRKLVREHPSTYNFGGAPYQPFIDFWLCPMVGYEFISKKRFFFKAYAMAILYRTNIIYYHATPWGGLTFGFKLDRRK